MRASSMGALLARDLVSVLARACSAAFRPRMRSPIAFWRSLARLVPVTVENLLHPHFVELSSESSLLCAISSVVERLLHTQEVAGSNPASRICLYAYGITAAGAELNWSSGA